MEESIWTLMTALQNKDEKVVDSSAQQGANDAPKLAKKCV
jgi:hypothetical protein